MICDAEKLLGELQQAQRAEQQDGRSALRSGLRLLFSTVAAVIAAVGGPHEIDISQCPGFENHCVLALDDFEREFDSMGKFHNYVCTEDLTGPQSEAAHRRVSKELMHALLARCAGLRWVVDQALAKPV